MRMKGHIYACRKTAATLSIREITGKQSQYAV